MRSKKLVAARNIRAALHPHENSLDVAIVSNAELIGAIVQGRLESGVAAEVGHEAFVSATASLVALRDARERMVECHRQLSIVRDVQGLDPGQVGCEWKVASDGAEPAVSLVPSVPLAANG